VFYVSTSLGGQGFANRSGLGKLNRQSGCEAPGALGIEMDCIRLVEPCESAIGSIGTNASTPTFCEAMAIWRTALSEDGVGGIRESFWRHAPHIVHGGFAGEALQALQVLGPAEWSDLVE